MKKARIGLLLAFVGMFAFGCGGKRTNIKVDSDKTSKSEYLQMDVDWVKVKGSKFDIQLRIQNISQKDIIVMLNDMSCGRGDVAGSLKHTFFNTGERTIDFRIGQSKSFRLVCRMGGNGQGPFFIDIARVYDNPTADGARRGDVLGKSMRLTFEAE